MSTVGWLKQIFGGRNGWEEKLGKTKWGAYRWWVYYYDPRPGVRKVRKSGPYPTRESALEDASDRRQAGVKRVRVTRTKRRS